MKVTRFIEDAGRDVRLAFRSFRTAPIVGLAAVASLALGIGANTAIFSVINSLLLRQLPVRDPSELVLLSDSRYDYVRAWSYPVWAEFHRRSDLFERSAAWSFARFNLAAAGEAELIDGVLASGSFFETFGVPPLVGRTFSDVDDVRSGGAAGAVAVISYGLWQARFGAAPDVLGRSLTIDGVPFTIVGVTPATFTGPEIGRTFDVIVPLETEPRLRGTDSFLDSSGVTFLTIVARLRADQSIDGATAAVRAVQPQIRETTLGDIGQFGSRDAIDRYLKAPFVLSRGATGYSGARDLRVLYQRPLLALMGVVVLLLLIACVNVANLLVARAIARRHELSVRLAIGATRARLVRQLLIEVFVLYGLGAAGGLAIALWSSRLLVHQLSTPRNPIVLDLSLDGRVLAFTVAVTVVTTLLFGSAPAFRAARVAPIEALKRRGRTGQGQMPAALSGSLIVVQVALSLILVFAAGLFVRSFASLSARALGFEPAKVAIVNINSHRSTSAPAQRLALYERVREAVRAVPDVEGAALSLTVPVGGRQFTPLVEISGVTDTRGPVWANLVSPGWFDTLGIPKIAGRDLTDGDHAGTPRVAVVNESFVRKFASGRHPSGVTLTLYPHTALALGPIEIVGVVGDAVYSSLRDPVPPTFYMPLAQFDHLAELGIREINLNFRSRTDSPMQLSKSVSTAITTVDPNLSLSFSPLLGRVSAALTQERVVAQLSACVSVLALLLAGLGLYGVAAEAAASRRTEIGIRMALGATGARIMSLMFKRALVPVAAGVALGIVISLWAAKLVGSLLYGVESRDMGTLSLAVVVLLTVAGLATSFPARRAARTEPAGVLHET
jgi:putative ABC transport system permease protein